MKTLITLCIILFSGTLTAQNIEGTWLLTHKNGNAVTDKEVIAIYQDGYFAYGAKETETNKFLSAGGGQFSINESAYTETQDFNTKTPEKIGQTSRFAIQFTGNTMEISDGETTKTWTRISDTKDDLTRNWVFTGRERNGEVSTTIPGDRRTVKILSGGRFQWIAFNSATKEFSGTGGGTYELKDGKYIENITFFSRDDSRVGASLEFDYEVKDGKWHHRGKSSKGDPIYEIWSPYSEAYKK